MSRNLSPLFSFLICLSILILPSSVQAGTPTVYVDPPSKTGLLAGDTFPVNVTVADVSLLYAWEFQIYYDSGILNASSWTPGPVFSPPDAMIFNPSWTDNYNATHGLIDVVCTLVGQRTFSGSATLATVYFRVKSSGVAALHLQNTLLLDNSTPVGQKIPHTTTDGMVYAGSTPGEVSVTSATPEKTVVGQGYPTRINVTVTNKGNVNETFSVTVQANATTVGTQTVSSLPNGVSTTLTLPWNTTGLFYGNYTISAYVNTANNNFTGGWVLVSLPGDITGPNDWPDAKVDMRDVAYVAKRFGTDPSSQLWNPNADINGDGKTDMRDVGTVAKNFGQHYP